MPTSISDAMLAEMENYPHRVQMVIEMTWDGTTYRYATNAVASESEGVYKPLVQSISPISDEANVWDRSIGTPRFSFSIFDEDRTLQELFGGPLRGRMTTGTVELWWRSPEVAAADHYRRFSGVVTKPSMENRVFTFSATTDVQVLDSDLKIPVFPRQDFFFAPERSTGVPLWVVYGRNNSSGLSDSKGMIECVPAYKIPGSGNVDLWIANYGQLAAVNRVYLDDVDRTADFTNFTMQRGTGLYHMVEYSGGNPHPDEDSTVRVDCDGLMDLGPTTGSVIRNPVHQIRHVLTNFVYGSGNVRQRLTWEPEAGKPIGYDTFTEAAVFYDSRNIEGAMVLRGNESGKQVFNRWCSDLLATPFFEDGWKLTAKPRGLHETTIYYDDAHVAQLLQHTLSPLRAESERARFVTDLDVHYLYDDARGAYTKNLKVSLRRSGHQAIFDKLEIKYGRHSVF